MNAKKDEAEIKRTVNIAIYQDVHENVLPALIEDQKKKNKFNKATKLDTVSEILMDEHKRRGL